MDRTVADFLRGLFRGWKSEDGYLVVWDGGTKRSDFFQTDQIDEAATLLGRRDTDIYFGCGLQSERLAAGERGTEKTISAIGCLWADCDYQAPGKIKQYPERDELLVLLQRRLPRRPSLIVDSGGGFHVYWIFRQMVLLSSSQSRLLWKTRGKAWQTKLKSLIGEMDMTHDLTRVLRPCWGWSHKHECRINPLSDYEDPGNWILYEEETWHFLDEQTESVSQKSDQIAIDFPDDMDSGVSYDKLEAVMANSPDFKKVWERKRADLPSQSEYDLSIASHLVGAGWRDGDIAKAIISHRRRHQASVEKVLERPKYLADTIALARSGQPAAVKEIVEADEGDHRGDMSPGGRELKVELLRKVLGLPSIQAVLRIGNENPQLAIWVAESVYVKFGTISQMTTGRRLEHAVAEATGILPLLPGRYAQRLKIYNWILDLAENVDAETSLGELLKDAMRMLTDDAAEGLYEDQNVAASMMAPFSRDGCYFFHLAKVIGKTKRLFGSAPTRAEAATAMRTIGAEQVKVDYRTGEKKSSRNYWKLRYDKLG